MCEVCIVGGWGRIVEVQVQLQLRGGGTADRVGKAGAGGGGGRRKEIGSASRERSLMGVTGRFGTTTKASVESNCNSRMRRGRAGRGRSRRSGKVGVVDGLGRHEIL